MIGKLKKHWYLIIIAVIVVVFIYRFTINKATAKTKKEETYIVQKQDLTEALTLSGKIDAEEATALRFQTSGRLSWVGVKEGDFVKKYQLIAALDQRETEKTLKKYLNTYLDTRWDFDQQKDDYKDKAISTAMQRVLDQAQFALDNSVLDVEIKNLAVEFSNLFTPIEGIVIKVDAPFAGVNVTPTGAEFEVVNPKTIFFSVSADQTEVTKLHEGLNGEIVLDSYPDKTLKTKVRFISFIPSTGETGTVYEIKTTIDEDNDNYQYKMGMTGDVNFILNKKKSLAIPTNFINSENGKKYVYKVINGKKTKIFIKTGDEYDSYTEVKNGLKEGDLLSI